MVSITRSTAPPACTMSITRRGLASFETSSSGDCAPVMVLPAARPARNASTFAVVRLYTATRYPWLAMLSTRFSPMTASPTTPMSASLMTVKAPA